MDESNLITKIVDKELIFLLGAGASVDAGMPTVAELTIELRKGLQQLQDKDGTYRPEFSQIFELIESCDKSVGTNYERFFEWIHLLLKVQKEPFRNLIKIKVNSSLVEAMAELTLVIGGEIARLLESYKTEPNYLTRLVDFLPPSRRLKVFGLNYDCCLEDACYDIGINLTTGFDPVKKNWNPSLFHESSTGINLYKLHGSLRWFGTRDTSLPNDRFPYNFVIMEVKPEGRQHLPSCINVTSEPVLILGPGSKVQPDDPFLTLLYEFQRSLRQTKICIIIGYSHNDDHINKIIGQAFDLGALTILDVNPGQRTNNYLGNRYHHLPLCAKSALVNGSIISELESLQCDL